MPLSIKNPRAERLARAIAKETGESMTQSIIEALEERLERIRGSRHLPDVVDEILRLSRRCAALPDRDMRSEEEILGYTETGTFD